MEPLIIFGILGVLILLAFFMRTRITMIVIQVVGMIITYTISYLESPLAENLVNQIPGLPHFVNEHIVKFSLWVILEFVYYVLTEIMSRKLIKTKEDKEKEHKKEKKSKVKESKKDSSPPFVPVLKIILFGTLFLMLAYMVTNATSNLVKIPIFSSISDWIDTAIKLSK
jgi:hypothetical protein